MKISKYETWLNAIELIAVSLITWLIPDAGLLTFLVKLYFYFLKASLEEEPTQNK